MSYYGIYFILMRFLIGFKEANHLITTANTDIKSEFNMVSGIMFK